MSQEPFIAARRAHLDIALRALRRHTGNCVLSHESMAIALRLPTYRVPPKPQLTRPSGYRRTTGRTDVSVAALPPGHVVLIDGVPGTVAATNVVRWADGRSETPIESVRRVDFLWEEVGLVGEADGRVKYEGDDGVQVLWEEKQRRDAIEDECAVIRWNWRQAHAPAHAFVARFERAWVRATRWKSAS